MIERGDAVQVFFEFAVVFCGEDVEQSQCVTDALVGLIVILDIGECANEEAVMFEVKGAVLDGVKVALHGEQPASLGFMKFPEVMAGL